jgi:hypothetical protein
MDIKLIIIINFLFYIKNKRKMFQNNQQTLTNIK